MFDLPPPKLPDNYGLILKHIDALRRLLNKLERQALLCECWNWQETFGEIREATAWIGEEIDQALTNEAWVDRKAEEAFYPPEVMARINKLREEDKRKRQEAREERERRAQEQRKRWGGAA